MFILQHHFTSLEENYEYYKEGVEERETYFQKVIVDYEKERAELKRWENNKKTWGAGGIVLGAILGILFGKHVL